MSGHSKWANIKHRKEKTDSQRGKTFTKVGREIAIAVREGGADPAANSKLRDAIAKARAGNMPNDNIARSIKKASGELGSIIYEEYVYEGFAPCGVAVIVEILTDNRNRTAPEIRHIFDKNGGVLGSAGCVGWMFERKGVIVIEKNVGKSEDELMELAIEAGAEDFISMDDAYEIYTAPEDFSAVREALEGKGLAFISAGLERIPQNTKPVDAGTAEKVRRLIELLEDNDDVQNVYHNAEFQES
ncbi:MAG: YebC/PmpR family DNA-binding transcriptional regulator [Bacillota bacterium]|nr:YebC/PmpR family DNA-binding transcriptional regulator [Bacillota bacterium]